MGDATNPQAISALKVHPPQLLLRLQWVLAVIVLAVLVFYSLVKLFFFPYMGFKHHPVLGYIGEIYVTSTTQPSLQVGDRLLQAGSVTWEEYRNDARRPFFEAYKPGEIVQLVVQRGDQTLTIPWQITTATLEEISDHLTLIWVPYIFWLMGTIVLFGSQELDSRRFLYVVFNYLTAIWVIAGLASSGRFFYSSIVMRMGIWLSVPVYWHFHWLFPQPLPRFNRRAFLAFYMLFGCLAVAEWFAWLPASLFPIGVILGLVGSLVLLFAHLISNPEQRRSLGVLGLAVGFSVAPGVLLMISYLTNRSPWSGSSVLLMTASIPVAYYYAGFAQPRSELGTVASHTITPLFFGLVTYSFLALGMLATQIWRPSTGREVPLAVDLSAMVGLFTAILYPFVQNVLDRRVFGVTIPPSQVLETYSARITTTLDIRRLAAVLRDEVLPSLSIHQAALVVLQPGGASTEILFQMGTPPGLKCELGDYAALREEVGRQRDIEQYHPRHVVCPWVHLALQLSLEQEEIGLLLLGRRDLGGMYTQADISALQALANQTALALVNIRQTEQLHALYQHDVINQEAMQHHLARELHDQVLNQLAALANQMDDQRFTPQIQAAYQKTVNSIRDMISGLRPSMLNYGLYSALEELVDDLNKQAAEKTGICLNLAGSSERYSPDVELQLFRIAQQAVHNALQHGGATRVELSGKLLPNSVELSIIDNGKGFDIPSPFDVISLLERQHFGLAGMYERAAIIHATIELQSRPGQGTHIIVRWQPPS